jgi:hypothetical protein
VVAGESAEPVAGVGDRLGLGLHTRAAPRVDGEWPGALAKRAVEPDLHDLERVGVVAQLHLAAGERRTDLVADAVQRQHGDHQGA